MTVNADGTVQILVEEAAPLSDFDINVSLDSNQDSKLSGAQEYCREHSMSWG